MSQPSTTKSPSTPTATPQLRAEQPRRLPGASDRSLGRFVWYRLVQGFFSTILAATGGIRASGRSNLPDQGPVLLVSNHLSHLDVLVLGILLKRPLNYVARSSLFFWPLGPFIRSVGAFPINREGMGAEGFKETLRRVRSGGIVTLFPEGTRTEDGQLGEMKSGIARLVARTHAPVVPAAIAGSFEAWPKSRAYPVPHPLRVHFGAPITTDEMANLDADQLTALIRQRILECQEVARTGIRRDLDSDLGQIAIGRSSRFG